jgi:ubiquinone/menaquinone biosynthesis C-methylase UbiE
MERTSSGRGRLRVNRLRDMDSEATARDYARTMGKASIRYDDMAGQIARNAPDARRILDVATGPGFLATSLARKYPSAEIVAMDISPAMIDLARRAIEEAGLGERVTVVEASAYAMPFDTGSFDVVATTEFLHMLDDLPPFFAEVHRVLAPGGRFAAFDHRRDVDALTYRLMWLTTWLMKRRGLALDGMGPVIDACWTRPEVDAALRGGGFRVFDIHLGLSELAVLADRG